MLAGGRWHLAVPQDIEQASLKGAGNEFDVIEKESPSKGTCETGWLLVPEASP